MSTEKNIGYARDIGCILVGLGGIVWQIVTGKTDAALLTVCMGLLGYAGAAQLNQLRPGARSTSGGRGRSSRSPSQASRSRSSSQPSDGGDEP